MPQLIHVSDLTKQVTALYRSHFLDFLRVLVWLLVPTLLSAILPALPLAPITETLLKVILQLLTIVISLWLSVVLVDLIVAYVGSPGDQKKIRHGSWGIAGRAVDFALISLLQGFVVLLGFVLFIIPGFIFANWFSFSRYAVLVDGSSPGSEALRASKTLVASRFWPIAWRWIGAYLYFGSFLGLGTLAVLAAIGALLGNPSLAFMSQEPLWWTVLVVSLVSVLTAPIFVAVGVILYEDAKRTK